MRTMLVEIELLSEAVFGNGESTTSFVDMEILKDDNNIPYFKGKTFKGKLREEAEKISDYLLGNREAVEELFGREDGEYSKLKFSDCKIDKDILNNIQYGINKGEYSKNDVEKAFTDIRTFTSIDESGVTKDGSLRQCRVVKKGIKLYCYINYDKLTTEERGLLACSISALRNIGTMESRGKGEVVCKIIQDGKDVTNEMIQKFEKVVS